MALIRKFRTAQLEGGPLDGCSFAYATDRDEVIFDHLLASIGPLAMTRDLDGTLTFRPRSGTSKVAPCSYRCTDRITADGLPVFTFVADVTAEFKAGPKSWRQLPGLL